MLCAVSAILLALLSFVSLTAIMRIQHWSQVKKGGGSNDCDLPDFHSAIVE